MASGKAMERDGGRRGREVAGFGVGWEVRVFVEIGGEDCVVIVRGRWCAGVEKEDREDGSPYIYSSF